VGVAVVFVLIVVVIAIVGAAAAGNYASDFDRLVASGIPARGILLQVPATGTKVGTTQRRFERRQVYIDVEIPGKEPYETSVMILIPINLVRDVLPGSTVELRIDSRNPSKMAIIGPGTGFVQTALRTA
jgi:hypothetical protein